MSKVLVLMSTYNGERYIEEQLQSITNLQDVEFDIFVRDDGSKDHTHKILNSWQDNSKLKWYTGENLKSAKSFMDLLMKAPSTDYYAFADQDDVWEEDKLYSAVLLLEQSPCDVPALYFSQTQLVDENLNSIETKKIKPECTFYESLMVNYATGCTFVFNHKLLELVRKYSPEYLSMHDYWLYHLCLAVGGNIYFDPVSHIKYRQHSNNVIGLSKGWKQSQKLRWKRTVEKECERSNTIIELYKGYKKEIKPEYLPVIKSIVNYKHSIKDLVYLIFNRRLLCRNWRTNLSMRIALLLHTY